MKFFYCAVGLLLISCLVTDLSAQVRLLKDIYQGPGGSDQEFYPAAIHYDNVLYFAAGDSIHGVELWKYDDTGVSLVKDINPGERGSYISHFVILDRRVVFLAGQSTSRAELWTTDGTADGTYRISDDSVGSRVSTFRSRTYRPNAYIVFEDELYFSGTNSLDQGVSGNQLWKTDGTVDGTVLVKQLREDRDAFPSSFTVWRNEVYFSANNGLWKTDGTTDGTILLKEFNDAGDSFYPIYLQGTRDLVYMYQDDDVWVTDGTSEGTVKLIEFINYSYQDKGQKFFQIGDHVLFGGYTPVLGAELYRSAGTVESTRLIKDLSPGSSGVVPALMLEMGGLLYYLGSQDYFAHHCVSDGTTNGTNVHQMYLDYGHAFHMSEAVTDGVRIYITAGGYENQELWITDETPGAAYMLKINLQGESAPKYLYQYKGKLFCYAKSSKYGYEPHIIDLASEISDRDGDGFYTDVDCDDTESGINPSAVEIPNNGVDEDCDGQDLITSVEYIHGIEVDLVPNPASEILHIRGLSSGDIYQIDVYSSIGTKLLSTVGVDALNVSNLESGIYFLSIRSRDSRSQSITPFVISH